MRACLRTSASAAIRLGHARQCHSRQFATTAGRGAAVESVTVPRSSNGSITVDITHPTLPWSATLDGRAPDVAIYLPRGPSFASDGRNASFLQSHLGCRVVQINYRCAGPTHRHPTPLHDVAAGYDWIISNLLPERSILRPGRAQHVGRIAICGELVGGQLATALALTECRVGAPGIVAAAVSNPLVDWECLDAPDLIPSPQHGSSLLKPEALLRLRNAMFQRPEHYHDPFASPVLFFRSAGWEVPQPVQVGQGSEHDEMDELVRFARAEYLRGRDATDAASDPPCEEELLQPERKKQRKASRRYPCRALGLRLPRFHISSGSDPVFSSQARELAQLLGQSFARQDKMRHGGNDVSSDASTGMVQCEEYVGSGLWDESEAGRARLASAARWIASVLGP